MKHILHFPRAGRATLVAGGALLVGACQDLNVPNVNNPTAESTLGIPSNVETAIGTQFKTWYSGAYGDDIRQGGTTYAPVGPLSGLAGETTSGTNSYQWCEVNCLPHQQYNNRDAGQWFNRLPYQQLLAVTAVSSEILAGLDKGMKLGTVSTSYPNGQHTERGRVFAKFTQALGHIYLGILFDKALLQDEKTPRNDFSTDFRPYPEVVAFGLKQLDDAIALAKKAPADTTPDTWVNLVRIPINTPSSAQDDLVRIMNSFAARALVYSTRTPEERAKVDWNRVISYVDQGIKQDFKQQSDQNIRGTRDYYLAWAAFTGTARVHNKLLGPADTTGAYQAWLAKPIEQRAEITIATPDRRVHGAGGPTTVGSYFQYLPTQTMSTTNGSYLLSRYKWIRSGTAGTAYYLALNPIMTVTEMNLLKAEALIRLGRAAEAVPLINATRVANGKLPAVDVNGPPQATAAQRASCVPRKVDGTCGNLMDALMYESRLENYGVEVTIAYGNARGWGLLEKGAMLHLPIPGRELQTLGLAYYTYGGDAPGSMP
jgi:hypothetical protein